MEWYPRFVRATPRCRISRAGGSAKSLLLCSASIAVVLALLASIAEIDSPAKPVNNSLGSTRAPLGDHYLLLVNTAMAKQMDAQKMAQFDRSPYDGLAVSFAGAYDASPVVSAAAMQAQIASWNKFTGKDIWPWVYLNRMVGANDAEGNTLTEVPYFQRFQGLDLDGKAGAQNDFLENWRNALHLAKETGVPGIVCDLEFYNNYKAYDLAELALMISRPQQDVVNLLRQLGARMADVASAEYPDATLWFLFTGLTRTDYRVIEGRPFYLAATYIAQGLLDQIQQRNLALKVLSGGEVGLGYCHTSVDDLRQAIEKRSAAFAPLLQKYNGILELAGTMTLWSDRSAKKNWVAQGACGASSDNTVEDLIPYMELLFRSYRYNWLYGSPNGGYLAFQSTSARRFDAAITEAKERAFGISGGRPGH